jgi:hypothetical protein
VLSAATPSAVARSDRYLSRRPTCQGASSITLRGVSLIPRYRELEAVALLDGDTDDDRCSAFDILHPGSPPLWGTGASAST